VPEDLESALATAPRRIQELWKDITPMARWEWVRWINATNNPDTRRRRVEVTISKMKDGSDAPAVSTSPAAPTPSWRAAASSACREWR